MTDRRTFTTVVTGGLLTSSWRIGAQPAVRMARVGYLGFTATNTADDERVVQAFRQGLREQGFIEGSNLVIESRFSEGKMERYADFAAELVRLKVDAIVVTSLAAARSAMSATDTIPIVMTGINDPVRFGLVASLARPGGNVTGLTGYTDDLAPKRLELLKAALPKVARVVIVRCPRCALAGGMAAAQSAALLDEQTAAARALGINLIPVEVNSPQEFESATAAILRERPDALLLANNPMNIVLRQQWAEFATAHKLPSVAGARGMGAMISYGPSPADMYKHAAIYVGKILNGAKPRDLPVEQPTTLELIINLKTAKALGLTIPQSLLLRSDEVIE